MSPGAAAPPTTCSTTCARTDRSGTRTPRPEVPPGSREGHPLHDRSPPSTTDYRRLRPRIAHGCRGAAATRALDALVTARDRTALLTSCVEDPDLTAQHSPLMSPLVWDLAHIGNQEEQWLLRTVAGQEALRPEIDGLYDAFEHPRSERPSLPLLAPAEARGYAAEVRGRVAGRAGGRRVPRQPR